MSKKESFEMVLAFYSSIVAFLRANGGAKEARIAHVMRVYEVIENQITLECTEAFLRAMHAEKYKYLQDKPDDYHDYAIPVVESAFADLARQMRNPAVRRVFDLLRNEVDLEKRDLFLHLRNAKLVAKDQNGPAIVTLVVDDLAKFKEFIANPNSVEWVRSSDETE